MVYLSEDIAENLNPAEFNCLRCDKQQKDLDARPVQCPRCDLTLKYEQYKREAVAQMLRFHKRWPRRWTLDALITLRGQVAALVGRRKDVNGRWPLRLARLARIYLEEQRHQQSVSNFQTLQRMKQSGHGQSGQPGIVQTTRIHR